VQHNPLTNLTRTLTPIAAFATAVLCCIFVFSSAEFLARHELAFPFAGNMFGPQPSPSTLPRPRLIRGGLPISTSSLLWSEDGTAIAILGGYYQPELSLQVVDTSTAELLKSEYIADASGDLTIHSPGLSFPHLDPNGYPLTTCPARGLKATTRELPDNAWELTIWESQTAIDSYRVYSPQWAKARLPPHLGNLTFSPSCQYLAFTLRGWVYYEGEGQEELWLLDLPDHDLGLALRGRWAAIRIWDYPVQNVAPSWSPDGSSVAFGDPQFGLEVFNVQTDERTWLSPPTASGYRPKWSTSGRWIASYREWSTETSVILTSADGKFIDSVGNCYFPLDVAWSPTNDELAFLCGDHPSSSVDLWLWSLTDHP